MQTNSPNTANRKSRLLLWLVLGAIVIVLVGGVAGVYIFREVLRPGQQQRVLEMAPFMSAFLSRPDPNATLPTASAPNNRGISPEDLLAGPLFSSTAEAAPVTGLSESLATPTPEATEVSSLLSIAAQAPAKQVVSLAKISSTTISPSQDAAPVLVSSVPRDHRLFGIRHVQQTWNNCGPANTTMALSYFGWQGNQEEAASYLKPDSEDKNVSPNEIVSFINENSGVRAITRMGGDMDLLRALIANEFPVIIESGYAPEGYDWIGHYRTVVGYDDNAQVFYIYDSYLGSGENGAGMAIPYAQFDHDWENFNRVFIALYLPERESELVNVLGERADARRAAELAAEVAQMEARENPQNVYAWFNLGTSLTRLGQYDQAAIAYDQATRLGLHYRMTWYQFGIFEAYFNTGRYDDVLSYVSTNLTSGGEYVEETHYWQGRVYAAQGRNDLAQASFQRALQHNPRFTAASDALAQLGA
jgi:hypothetical protein